MYSKLLWKEPGYVRRLKDSDFKYSLFILTIPRKYVFIFKGLPLKSCKPLFPLNKQINNWWLSLSEGYWSHKFSVSRKKVNLSNLGFWATSQWVWGNSSNKHNLIPCNFQNNSTSCRTLQILLSQTNQRVYGLL